MGDPRRQRRQVITPSHPWEKTRIQEELQAVGEYGLRNKRELWKHKTQLSQFRQTVRKLRALPPDVAQKQLKQVVARLVRMGFLTPSDHTFDDVLNLSVKDFLDRRLQTHIVKIGLAQTMSQARQFIVHRHIAVNGQILNSPSYLIQAQDEGKIAFAAWSPYANKEHPIYQNATAPTPGQGSELSGEGRPPKRPAARPRKGGRGPNKEGAEGEEAGGDAAADHPEEHKEE